MHHHQNGSGLAWSKCFQAERPKTTSQNRDFGSKPSDLRDPWRWDLQPISQANRVMWEVYAGSTPFDSLKCSLTSPVICGCTYVSHAVDDSFDHLELTSPFLAQGGINLPSANTFQQIYYVIIIATVMSFHLFRISNFNDTFPPKSCHFLTRIPCPSSESAINRWTSESWKFRNAQFGEAQWMELLLTQFI